jgi:hypothetical protein
MPQGTTDLGALRTVPTNSVARSIAQLLQCNETHKAIVLPNRHPGLLQIAVSTLLRTNDIVPAKIYPWSTVDTALRILRKSRHHVWMLQEARNPYLYKSCATQARK